MEEDKKNSQNSQENEKSSDDQKIYPHQLPLATLLTWFIGILNGKAWEYLGLMMNPETKELNQDLKKAKIAIDSIDFMLERIKHELETEDKKQLENILANLQMNYIEKAKKK